MPRFVAGALAGVTVAGLTLAAAGGLTVSGGLGAGQGSAAACDADGVSVSWSTGSDATLGYTLSSVTVAGIDTAACNGRALSVSLSDGNDQRVGGGGPVTVDSATMAVPLSATVAAAAVGRVHVLLG